MRQQLTSTPPSQEGHGEMLQLFIGVTEEEQTESLQDLKDSMAEVIFSCLADELSLSEKSLTYLRVIYETAQDQIENLKNKRYLD